MHFSSKQSKEDIVFDFFNIVAIAMILVVVGYPLIHVLSASFSSPLALYQGKVWLLPQGINIESYRRVFLNQEILTGYRNTIIYTLVGTTVNVFMTIFGAYPLSRKNLYGRSALTAFFAFTMFFHGGLIPTYLLIKSLGLYNNFWVMILPGAVSVYNMIIMRTFFQTTISEELHDAAKIDGCGNVKTLFSIVLPLSTPVIAVMVLFYGVAHWNSFFNAMIYLKDRSRFPLQLILREILIQSQFDNMSESVETSIEKLLASEGIQYALILVASLPVLMLYPFLQKYFVQGMMVGSVKG